VTDYIELFTVHGAAAGLYVPGFTSYIKVLYYKDMLIMAIIHSSYIIPV